MLISVIKKEQIKKLREQDKLTYDQIGKLFGISRQRVHQVYKNYKTYNHIRYKIIKRNSKCVICGSKEKLEIHHIDFNSRNNNYKNIIILCKKCHSNIHCGRKKDVIPIDMIENKCLICGKKMIYPKSLHYGKGKKYCSNECKYKSDYLKSINKKYFTKEDKVNAVKKSQKKYYNKIKNRPEFKEKQKIYIKDYYEKNKNNPLFIKKKKLSSKKQYEKIKHTEKYKKMIRRNCKKYRERKKLLT